MLPCLQMLAYVWLQKYPKIFYILISGVFCSVHQRKYILYYKVLYVTIKHNLFCDR